MKTNNKQIFGRWFEVMTAGTSDKVALYWYVEPSVLTHMSWCGDYTHTHTCTLTQTHAPTHARNTHTYTRSHARMHATLTRTHARMHAHTSTPHDQHTL